MTSKWSTAYWTATAERVASTAIQVFISFVVLGVPVLDLDYGQALQLTGTAALLSLLKNILANLPAGSTGPSLVGSESVTPAGTGTST